MARILALDTSTEACSCALLLGSEVVEDHAVIPRQHAQRMLAMIDGLMEAREFAFSDLDAVAWGRGPGSFTGLRIAAGVAQGIAFAADVPVISVSTLAALALQHHELHGSSSVFACIDARIDELYWGCFRIRDGMPQLVGEEQLCAPEALPLEYLQLVFGKDGMPAVGSGLVYETRFPAALRASLRQPDSDLLPRASAIARLAEAGFSAGHAHPAQEAQPVYLRDKVTHG